MAKSREEQNFIRIVTVDGSDAYRAMHRLDGAIGLSARDEKGNINRNMFDGVLDESLDTDQLRRVYAECDAMHGRFNICKGHTLAVVNVTFSYALKKYYNKGKYLFVKDGYDVTRAELSDHVAVREIDGKRVLIAIEVAKEKDEAKKKKSKAREHTYKYESVKSPIEPELLGEYFEYDSAEGCYRVKRKTKKRKNRAHPEETLIPTVLTKSALREWLYTNGFDLDGVHYVRYKRSAGSSREGHCLFIAEPLYADMMAWSSAGLDGASFTDQASWQAYISLTLSSIEKRIHLPRHSILLVRDQYSIFDNTVIRVRKGEGGLTACRERVRIRNCIWDGEALLDSSVFEANGYGDKGMMLLRNRFFKTCAFNTNLAEWLADHGITRIDQLNGYHSRGASLKDIKLVITESSLKYLKFKPDGIAISDWFERWLDNIYTSKDESAFGVVKTDKSDTDKLSRRLVKTNYQLLNTLRLTRDDVDKLLSPSLDYLRGMQTEPMMLRYHTRLTVADEMNISYNRVNARNYRQRIITDVMRCADNFEYTPFYKSFRAEQCTNFKERLKFGRVSVNGGNHTLFGNGIELLECLIDKDYRVDKPAALSDGEVYSARFADGEQLLCERSPHITMGNLLVAKNKHVPLIDKYFNLGAAKSIVCVNAIGSNIQQRLNGCDYDSDFMLITNDPTLLGCAAMNYDRFPVPFSDIESGEENEYSTSPSDLSRLDVQISENRIGEIVNLSQFLNSIYWDRLNSGEDFDSLEELYCDICKLAVLSGLEIDKAKRPYPVSAGEVLANLRKYKDDYRSKNGGIPRFFEYITESDSEDGVDSAALDTAMSFVYDKVKNGTARAPQTRNISYTDLFDLKFKAKDPNYAFAKRRDSIIAFVSEAQEKIKSLNYKSATMNRAQLKQAEEQEDELFANCLERVGRSIDDHVCYLLLRELDLDDNSKKDISSCKALLFASMLYANDGYLMKRLHRTGAPMHDLVFCDEMPTDPDELASVRTVYGYPHIPRVAKE